jgi:hypothetical protein
MWDMIFKPRFESKELRIWRSVHTRGNLTQKELSYYFNLVKGFEGEQNFDILLEDLTIDCLILNDLLLEFNNSVFQIDSLILIQSIILLCEVKNFEGDYYISGESWYKKSGKCVNDPFLQVKRSEPLLQGLIQNLGFNISIEKNLIFVNPAFYLYQAPLDLPIIFPTQLQRFLSQINTKSSMLNNKHRKLAEQLKSLHLPESPYAKYPDYNFTQLKKGITCRSCHAFINDFIGYKIVCKKCGSIENVNSAILRSVNEYKLLFPERKITTNDIHEWCGIINYKKRIQMALLKNYKLVGHGKSAYYIDSNNHNE